MSWILPLLVGIPLLAAAVVAGGDHVTPRPIQQAVALAASAATLVLALVLMVSSEDGEIVHWFGGWTPRHGVSLGIVFTAEPLTAALTAVTAGIVFLALAYSVVYLPDSGMLYHTLMLVCLGAMCGFVLSGDLFNMFVWLELMGVAGYALTGFNVASIGPLQGAVNFAIVMTVGGYVFAIGIALLYARTGALNLAQIGHTLSGQKVDGLLVVAMTLTLGGMLVKAAIVPFHLWVADAYAVAPVPVCLVFAGVMTDIGLVGVARLYWTVFDAPFGPHQRSVGDLLLWLGIVTGLVGGVMAFLQRHLKRMLAYSVISHVGIMLAGIGLLSSKGLAGTADLLLSHAFLTGGLFLVVGVLLVVGRSADELELRGRGRRLPVLAALWFVGAVALTGPPYVGVYLGHALIDEAASDIGRHWVQPLLWLANAVASAALLRAGARVFLGWGAPADPLLSPELPEEPPEQRRGLPILLGIAALAIALGLATSVVPGLAQRSEHGADRFRDRTAYSARVLHGTPEKRTPQLPFTVVHTTWESIAYGAAATLLALALAAAGLWRPSLPRPVLVPSERILGPPVRALKAVHSGVVGDYVMWLVVGIAVTGGVWVLLLR